jgi:hypothetical protein
MPAVAEARPPYVVFETRPVEDRAASIEKGHYVTKDVDVAIITPMGSKDRTERIVTEWFAQLQQQVAEGRFPREWRTEFMAAHAAWKEGRELPLSGTPILTWPVASPAQVKSLLDAKVRTVEDLAQANEETIAMLGMGGRALKDKAVSWLQSANSTGKVTEELAAMRVANASLVERNAVLEKAVADLKALVESQTRK